MKVSELRIVSNWLIVACDAQVEEQCTKDGKDCIRSGNIRGGGGGWKHVTIDEAAACLPDLRAMVFPGTKWCGPGNIADGDDDLGIFAHTDKCCRAHDKCDDKILVIQTKFYLTNDDPLTRVTCKCDKTFKKCLRHVNSLISVKIGLIYFNMVGNQCFKKAYPSKCEKFSNVPARKCVKYSFDKSKPKVYQWFHTPDFLS